ncbi:hypothetical protein CLOP_g23031 [Closterium sp. NIES-67]|nr:hypothetical protein CLOP_g23031 [Closterium sp. NIES-67]
MVNVTAEHGALLRVCGKEMGVPDGMWYPGAPCSIDTWLMCNPEGTVNGIVIRDKGISGSICSDIGLLTSLEKIDFANNSLSSSLPTSIGNLRNLKVLDINSNGIAGPLVYPPGTLSNLKLINVARNSLSGPLPSSIYTLVNLQEMDLSFNEFKGSLPISSSSLSNLKMLNLASNQFSGDVPPTLGNLTSLTRLELSRNFFTGTLSSSLAALTALVTLHLEGNQLGGSLPSQFGALIYLIELDLSGNQLNGVLPPTIGNLTSLTLLNTKDTGMTCPPAAGHPSCAVWQTNSSQFCQACPAFCANCSTAGLPPPKPSDTSGADASTSPASPPTPPPSSSSSSTPRSGFIVGIAVGAGALLLLAAIAAYLWFRCYSRGKPNLQAMPNQHHMCRRYTLEQVKKATRGWVDANHIGTGGYGEVYRGVCPFDDSVVWAVKRAKILTNDFKREVEEMASKSHPHLVRLLGYCVDMDMATEHHEQIVIYEFCSNGDLEKYLSGGAREGELTLQQRMEVLVGVARGLEYLHQFDIVHRDIKPANVLLDANMQAKVSDFGLVRMTEGTTVNPTRVVGTPGYVDPAYSRTNKATPMADVHSYGVMLLEVITLKPVTLSLNGSLCNIKDWIRPFVEEGNVSAFKDPLLPETSNDLILTLARIGLECTALPTSSRPSMADVAQRIEALRREHFGRRSGAGGSGRDDADVDQRMAKIDQEMYRRAESGLSIQEEFVRLNVMSEDGTYNNAVSGFSTGTAGYSNRSSGVLLQSQELSQELRQEFPTGR